MRHTFTIAVVLALLTFACVSHQSVSAEEQSIGQPKVVEIYATMSPDGTEVFFDPIGIKVEVGTTIRWILGHSYHTVTGYHPTNGNRELRIPETAVPWDSGLMIEPNSTFEVTLTAPGVYDYFCFPHEAAGMVGRIIVGEPQGPGTLPFGYDTSQGWRTVPKAAQDSFPSIDEINSKGVVYFGDLN